MADRTIVDAAEQVAAADEALGTAERELLDQLRDWCRR
jgi:hypothetical protein